MLEICHSRRRTFTVFLLSKYLLCFILHGRPMITIVEDSVGLLCRIGILWAELRHNIQCNCNEICQRLLLCSVVVIGGQVDDLSPG